MLTYIATHKTTTYILERARKGSAKLIASAMPADRAEPDRRIPLNKVPIRFRREARAQLAE